jgi:DNA-binding NarL/FixJ family response regulator
MTRRLVAEYAVRAKQPQNTAMLEDLTGREREVMTLVAAGLSNQEIAARLYLSPATARTHVSRAMTKARRPRPIPAACRPRLARRVGGGASDRDGGRGLIVAARR